MFFKRPSKRPGSIPYIIFVTSLERSLYLNRKFSSSLSYVKTVRITTNSIYQYINMLSDFIYECYLFNHVLLIYYYFIIPSTTSEIVPRAPGHFGSVSSVAALVNHLGRLSNHFVNKDICFYILRC